MAHNVPTFFRKFPNTWGYVDTTSSLSSPNPYDMPRDQDYCTGQCGIEHGLTPGCRKDLEWLENLSKREVAWVLSQSQTWPETKDWCTDRLAMLNLKGAAENTGDSLFTGAIGQYSGVIIHEDK